MKHYKAQKTKDFRYKEIQTNSYVEIEVRIDIGLSH